MNRVNTTTNVLNGSVIISVIKKYSQTFLDDNTPAITDQRKRKYSCIGKKIQLRSVTAQHISSALVG